MKWIGYVRTVIVCLIFLAVFCLTSSMILVGSVMRDNPTDNRVFQYLLRNVTIQTSMEDDSWMQKYPYEYSLRERYLKKVDTFKRAIESYCTVSFPESKKINEFVSWVKQMFYHYEIDDISAIYEEVIYVQQPAQNVIDFSKRLEKGGYPFLYVQTPSEDSILYYQGRKGQVQNLMISERSKAFMGMLEREGIPTINVARDYGGGMEYDASDHWFPENALSCAALIAERLNHDYDFSFELADYEGSKFYDLMEQYPHIKEQIEANCGYVFRIPVPLKEMDYSLQYAEDVLWDGDFPETLIKDDSEWNIGGGAYHNVFQLSNSLIYSITNHSADTNQGKKILILGDSFDWPVCSYLSIGIEQVTVIHNASFTGSIMSYVREMDPDVVLMVYNDAEFYEIYMEDAYYLE